MLAVLAITAAAFGVARGGGDDKLLRHGASSTSKGNTQARYDAIVDSLQYRDRPHSQCPDCGFAARGKGAGGHLAVGNFSSIGIET